MKRKIIIKGLKDKFTVTPEIKNHLNLLKEYYEKQDISKNNIDIQIILLRNKGLTRKEICEELNINIKQLEYRITKINKEKNMRKPQSEKDQAYIIVDNFIESIMSWCEVIVVAIKNEDYERAQAFKEIVDDNIKLTAEDLTNVTGIHTSKVIQYLDEQRNYIIEKLMENDWNI